VSKKQLNTPILFVIFNRPNTTQKVFEKIRDVQPRELYIAADGPREDRSGESELCDKTRSIIDQIDWECNVNTLFSRSNLGCKMAVYSAINWFFGNVDCGIILEDDCVPDQSFFWFCQELLNRYTSNEQIMMIAGTNYLFNKIELSADYFFSKYYSIWGWATWKRAWKLYDLNMTSWPEIKGSKFLSHSYSNNAFIRSMEFNFQNAYDNKIDTWDYQWFFACLINNGLSIVPKYNLISNIGVFGSNFSGRNRFNDMPTKPIDINNLIHPSEIIYNEHLDRITVDTISYRALGFKLKCAFRKLIYD